MDRTARKEWIRAILMRHIETMIEAQRKALHARGHDISIIDFLDAMKAEFSKAEVQWRAEGKGLELSEEYIALRREIYFEIIDALKRKASN